MSITVPDYKAPPVNPDAVKTLKKKIINDYLDVDNLSDVTATGAIASVNNSAIGKPRVGQMKKLLDKARHIYWNLRYDDMKHMSEEFWEDQIMLLSGMCPSIKLVNQYCVTDDTDNHGKAMVRFFDLVHLGPRIVRVFELKARAITVDDVLSTVSKGSIIGSKGVISCKNYPEVMQRAWPDKECRLIFTSPYGIHNDALDKVRSTGTYYVNYRELARSIYKQILESYPQHAEWKYEAIKSDKYKSIF